MILTDEQKKDLVAAVGDHISPFDKTLLTLFRTSNKQLQVFWALGEEAHYISQLCGMTFSRKAEFPWSLGYVSFSSSGLRQLHQKMPIGTQVDLVKF